MTSPTSVATVIAAPPTSIPSSTTTTTTTTTTRTGGAKIGILTGPVSYPFWFGGSASSMAACVTHPLDLVKVRLQTQNAAHGPHRNMLQMTVHVVRTGGIQGLYKGISASLLRQITYSTTRFGVYEHLKQSILTSSASTITTSASSSSSITTSKTKEPKQLPFFTLIGIASISGLIGGIAGNPADVLNVRMQHDAALPLSDRRNYKNVIDGLIRMSREEGPSALFRGVGPNCARAVLMTCSQLATYDQFKGFLRSPTIGMADSLTTHFTASLLAGFVATTVCSPFDVLKTRVMSAASSSGSGNHQQSIRAILTSICRTEGLSWIFRGWVPSFIRLGPQTIFTFLFLEQHKKLYRSAKGLPEP